MPRFRCLYVLTVLAILPCASLEAGDISVDGKLISTTPTGTPPLEVASTTSVANLNADLLDGVDSSAFARDLGNVVRVGGSGGDFTSIQAALDSITTASALNPYLVLVGPGVFAERVVMKPFVDIQGAGEGITKITQSGSTDPDLGTVAGADDAQLRFLTVENSGGSAGVIGVFNEGVSPTLTHVTVLALSTGPNLAIGVLSRNGGSPDLDDLKVRAVNVGSNGTAIGLRTHTGSSLTATDTSVEASGEDGLVIGAQTQDASSRMVSLDVEADSSGTGVVIGVANELGATVSMLDVRTNAVTGGGTSIGVNNHSSTVEMIGGSVSASGGSADNYGVLNEEGGETSLRGLSVTAIGGGTFTFGVYQLDAPAVLSDCVVEATGNVGLVGAVFASGGAGTPTHDLDVHRSELSGTDAAISANADYTVRVGGSQLDGGVAGAASYTCVHAYDGSFAALGTNCL